MVFYIRRIRHSFPFLFLAKPTPPFYLKLILIKISIRCEQGTAKFMTQACHLSSFASSRKTFNIYILRAQLGRLYPVENNKIMKGIEKERSHQASEAPRGDSTLAWRGCGKGISGEAPRGDSTPKFPWNFVYIKFFLNVTFDVSLDMRVHTTSGTSWANRVAKRVFSSLF